MRQPDKKTEPGGRPCRKATRKKEAPFWPQFCGLLFGLHLLVTLGFGVLELMNSGRPTSPALVDVLGGLLASGAATGLPVIGISVWQIKTIQKKQLPQLTLWYKLYIIVCGVLVAGLFLAWVAALIFG
ncbi:hypothetical protein LJC61_01980 [Ruminococcaceae bacterium OttesenSCG-928-A16]|nr:hypothetical protein [Ruminococcaceae bacterium OttesenSCG-928-A16]